MVVFVVQASFSFHIVRCSVGPHFSAKVAPESLAILGEKFKTAHRDHPALLLPDNGGEVMKRPPITVAFLFVLKETASETFPRIQGEANAPSARRPRTIRMCPLG